MQSSTPLRVGSRVRSCRGTMDPVSRSRKILLWTAVGLVLILVLGAGTAVWTVRRSFPTTSGTLDVPGLADPVSVLRDGSGIPQIYADTADDLFFAQGFVQAQDRFFQMDFQRHLTAGTLSSLFGSDALDTDMFVRTLGWQRVAEQELSVLSPETRRYLADFSRGVNAYLADHHGGSLSLEYAMLKLNGVDATPAPWTPADSLAWIKALAWDLGSNLEDEIDRSLDATSLSPSEIAELYPPYPYDEHDPILTQGAVISGKFEQDASPLGGSVLRRPSYPAGAVAPALAAVGGAAAGLDRLLGSSGVGIGSNSWVVSGSHTASGRPLLANDPHLSPSMPGVWYQMGLHCRHVGPSCPFDVSGFTLPGLPGVVIGHNDSIAWGFTNLGPDTQDLYLERVRGNEYYYDGAWVPMQTRTETFDVAGGGTRTITVQVTRDGPIVSGVDDDLERVGEVAPVSAASTVPSNGLQPRRGGYAVALKWTALTPGRAADALFGLDRARNWGQFRVAASHFDSPSQNIVYADVRGHIGYQAPGRIPIRQSGTGDWPVPGWDPAYQWKAKPIPFAALPHVLDPTSGFVVTANQPVIGPHYPYYLGDSFDYGYRSQRIRDLINEHPKLTVAGMAGIQLDTFSSLASTLTPVLLSTHLPTPYYRLAQATLRNWNYRMSADSPGAAYFAAVWRNLLALTFHDQLPPAAWPDGGSRWWAVVENLLGKPRDSFWDNVHTPKVETRNEILRLAMEQARDGLTRLRSNVPGQWRWGNLHQLTLRNQTMGAAGSPVAFLFNRGPYDVAGSGSVVDATAFDASEGYDVTAVPSMRMVVSLANFDDSRWINLTGASGHAFNAHYTDQTELWLDGRSLPWAFSTAAVKAATQDTLELLPTGDDAP